KSLSSSLFNMAKVIPEVLVVFIVFAVAVFLFSYSMPVLKNAFLSLFEESSRHQVDTVLQNLRSSIFGFIRAQFILSALTYIISVIGLIIIGVNYPFAIGLVIIIVDIMPI